MSLKHKIEFHFFKIIRMLWFNIRYRIYPWKKSNGIFLPVFPSMGYSVLRFIDNGQYEYGEINIVKSTLEKTDTVIELGTGLGYVSAYCAKLIGNENVYTYEANSNLEKQIHLLYKKNNVYPKLIFAMLGKSLGSDNFYVSKDGFFSSSTEPIKNATRINVDVISLNDEIKKLNPTYLIMDIEGGEYEIFKLIKFNNIKKIQFELHPFILGENKILEIFSILKENGFEASKKFDFRDNYFFSR
jgi:FkbM family methyltransferase